MNSEKHLTPIKYFSLADGKLKISVAVPGKSPADSNQHFFRISGLSTHQNPETLAICFNSSWEFDWFLDVIQQAANSVQYEKFYSEKVYTDDSFYLRMYRTEDELNRVELDFELESDCVTHPKYCNNGQGMSIVISNEELIALGILFRDIEGKIKKGYIGFELILEIEGDYWICPDISSYVRDKSIADAKDHKRIVSERAPESIKQSWLDILDAAISA